MKTDAETGVMRPQAEDTAAPEAGRGREGPPLEPLEGAWPCDTLSLDFGPAECERINVWFEPRRLWPFVTAVSGN